MNSLPIKDQIPISAIDLATSALTLSGAFSAADLAAFL